MQTNLKHYIREVTLNTIRTRLLNIDGVVNQYGNWIGILLITLEGSHMALAIKLNFKETNNMAEYKACIAGMEAL